MFPQQKRPLGITLLAIMLLWIGGFGTLIFPVFIVTGATKQLVELWLSTTKHSNVVIVAIATVFSIVWWGIYALYAFIGFGLWKLRRWAWKAMVIVQWTAIGLFVVQSISFWFIFSSAVMGIGAAVFELGITGCILWYLYRPAVRWPFEATYAAAKSLPIPPPPVVTKTARWIKISIGIGIAVVIFGVFTGCLMYAIEKIFRASDVYKIALADANASPCVIAKVGQPIVGKGSIEGSLDEGEHGRANLDFGIHGPRGDASVTLVAKKHDGAWEFATLTVDPYEGTPIQLLPTPTPCGQ